MDKFLKDLGIYAVFTSIAFIVLAVMYSNQYIELKKIKEESIKQQTNNQFLNGGDILKAQYVDSLHKVIDSIHNENFVCQIEKGRYDVALEIFMERNPKSAKQFATIISEETE